MGHLRIRVHPLTWITVFVFLLAGQAFTAWMWCLVLISHELAHVLAADAAGVDVEALRIYPFGAALDMPGIDRARPQAQVFVALAGPLQNVLFLLLALAVGHLIPIDGGHLMTFVRLNAAMAMANLLPAHPLDGGRILRVLLLGPLGPEEARARAGAVSLATAGVVAAVSVLLLASGVPAGSGLLFAGALMWAWRQETSLSSPRVASHLEGRRALLRMGVVLGTKGLIARADVPLGDVMAAFRPDLYHRVLVVDRGLSLLGEITEEDLRRGLLEAGLDVPVGNLVR